MDLTPLPMLARRAAALISTITIDIDNVENLTSRPILLTFLPVFKEKCKKVG